MFGFGGPWAALFENPWLGLAVFLAVSAGVILLVSGGRLMEALGAMFRVALTIFTTPFVFMRDAMNVIRNARETELDYAESRVFTLFRYSRIQYLGLFIVALLTLSGGITASLFSLYPQAELEQHRQLGQQIEYLRGEVQLATEAVASSGSPEARQALETRRAEAEAAYNQQAGNTAAFLQNTRYSVGAISQIANAGSTDYLQRIRNDIDGYMSNCPRGYNFSGLSSADCPLLRAYLFELIDRRMRELNFGRAFLEADQAWREADVAAQAAQNRLAELQANLVATEQQKASISLLNPSWIASRGAMALAILLSTLWSVIVIVWFGALLIEFLSWIILMMRSMEKDAEEKLARGRSEYR